MKERYEKLGKTVYILHLKQGAAGMGRKIINVNYTDDDPSFKIIFDGALQERALNGNSRVNYYPEVLFD